MCRTMGVESIRFDSVELHLGAEPQTKLGQGLIRGLKEAVVHQSATYPPGTITADTKIITDELTDEQRMFWSSNTSDPSFDEGQPS